MVLNFFFLIGGPFSFRKTILDWLIRTPLYDDWLKSAINSVLLAIGSDDITHRSKFVESARSSIIRSNQIDRLLNADIEWLQRGHCSSSWKSNDFLLSLNLILPDHLPTISAVGSSSTRFNPSLSRKEPLKNTDMPIFPFEASLNISHCSRRNDPRIFPNELTI